MLADRTGGAAVTTVARQVVGTGQMGDCVRLTVEYDRPGSGPDRMIAKLPSVDPTSRATAAALRSYEIEVNFYRSLAPTLSVRVPDCYHGQIDPETADFVLLLEEISAATQGDQLAGCHPDQAAAAIAELPGLHAPRWGDPALKQLDWLHRNTEESKGMLPALVGSLYPGFVERYADRIDSDVMALCERLVAGLAAYDADRPEPWTAVHGDFRLDNLLFPEDGNGRVAVLDWQTAVLGPGVTDLSYFIGAGLTVDDRRRHETDLVRSYHERMRAAGVDLGWDDLWQQYRRYTFAGVIMAIAASMLVQRTDRGDDMFVTMAQRHGRHALDLEAGAFLT